MPPCGGIHEACYGWGFRALPRLLAIAAPDARGMICCKLHHPFQPLLQRKLLKPRGGVLKWLSKNGAVAAEHDGSGVDWGATCGLLRTSAVLLRGVLVEGLLIA